MKNIAILFLSSFFLLSSFSSCKKCAHCETAGVKSSQFCGSTGVSTNDVYSTQKTKCENNGGSWIIE